MSTSSPSLSDLSLVPTDRLAALVTTRARAAGLRIVDLLGWEPDDAHSDVDLEDLNEETIRAAATAIRDHDGERLLIPPRSLLHLDLKRRLIRVEDSETKLSRRRGIEHLCRDYLHFVSELRGLSGPARFPVRILLDAPPDDLMRYGATAVIVIDK